MVDADFKVNTNLAISQTGSQEASQAYIVLGGAAGVPTKYSWDDLRYVLGSNNPSLISVYEDFVNSGITVGSYYTVTSNGTAAATTVSATEAGGVAILAGGTDDNGFSQLSTTRAWTVGNGRTFFEARFKKNTATPHGFEIGVATVALIATDGIMFSDHTAAGVTASANISTARCIVVGADTDSSATVLSVCSHDGTTAAAVDSAAAYDTSWHTVRFEIEADTTTRVYVDDVLTATLVDVFLTSSQIAFYFASKSLSGAAATQLYVDYVGLVGPR